MCRVAIALSLVEACTDRLLHVLVQVTSSSKQGFTDQKAAGSHALQQDQHAARAYQSPEVEASVHTAVHRSYEQEEGHAPADSTSPLLSAEPAQQPHEVIEEVADAVLDKEQYQSSPVTGQPSNSAANLQSSASLSASHADDTQLACAQHNSDLAHEHSSSASQASAAEELDALSPDEDDYAEHLELAVDPQPSSANQPADSLSSSASHPAATAVHDDAHATVPAEVTLGAEADIEQVPHFAEAAQSIETVPDAAQNMVENQAHVSIDEQEQSMKEQAHQDSSKNADGILSTTQTDDDSQDAQDTSQRQIEHRAQQSQQGLPQPKSAEDIDSRNMSDFHADMSQISATTHKTVESAMDKAEEAERRLLTGKSPAAVLVSCQCHCAFVQAPGCSLGCTSKQRHCSQDIAGCHCSSVQPLC